MKHLASAEFRSAYDRLPADIRTLADKNFALLKVDPRHPSLHFKDVGKYWSVRIGSHYRALAKRNGNNFHWHWIGSHAEYDKLIR